MKVHLHPAVVCEQKHLDFANEGYGVEASEDWLLVNLFDKIVTVSGCKPLKNLKSKTKRKLLHWASVYPGYGKAWFEEESRREFLIGQQSIAKRIERRENSKVEQRELNDAFARIPVEQRAVLGGLPAEIFYKSPDWRKLRFRFLGVYRRCFACGAKATDGVRMHVDHIHPRHLYPQWALNPQNLQLLCEDCHVGKGPTVPADFTGREAIADD